MMEVKNKGAWQQTVGIKITRASGQVVHIGIAGRSSFHPNPFINFLWQLRDAMWNQYYRYKIKNAS